MVQGRCMKCKAQVELQNPVVVQTARGGYMAKGKCAEHGITVCAMMSKDNAEKAIKEGAKKGF